MATKLKFADGSTLKFNLQSLNYKASARATDHKIEDGAEINDHVVTNQDEISLSGMTSTIFNDGVGGDFEPELAWEKIRKSLKDKSFVELETEERSYKNYVITSFSTNKDKNTGGKNAIYFSLDLKEIVTVRTKTAKQSTKNIKGQDKKNRNKSKSSKGKQQTSPAPANVTAIKTGKGI